MSLELLPYRRNMKEDVLQLILQNLPESCVLFAERFEKAYFAKCFVLMHEKMHEKKVCGAFLISKTGLLLFCIPSAVARGDRSDEAKAALREFFEKEFSQKNPITCISGEKHGVLFLSALCAKSPNCTQRGNAKEYALLKHDGKTFAPPNPVFPPVVRCSGKKYFSSLLPLRREYERVEVCEPSGIEFSEQRCRAALLRLLLSHEILALPFGGEKDKHFAATAAVSAETAHFVQIGGVFTETAFRGRGMACFLTQIIAREAFLHGKQTVLFVRKTNTPALQAYTNAGFSALAEYAIVYFE
ncbi:MAG: GNAT family N-acetyltransferase [Treponemataceae bacterium]|nr:MAG: GNAT family N-acetyltransferase [Treponemataceae bacterium]